MKHLQGKAAGIEQSQPRRETLRPGTGQPRRETCGLVHTAKGEKPCGLAQGFPRTETCGLAHTAKGEKPHGPAQGCPSPLVLTLHCCVLLAKHETTGFNICPTEF